jgi:hypothetical protein
VRRRINACNVYNDGNAYSGASNDEAQQCTSDSYGGEVFGNVAGHLFSFKMNRNFGNLTINSV